MDKEEEEVVVVVVVVVVGCDVVVVVAAPGDEDDNGAVAIMILVSLGRFRESEGDDDIASERGDDDIAVDGLKCQTNPVCNERESLWKEQVGPLLYPHCTRASDHQPARFPQAA